MRSLLRGFSSLYSMIAFLALAPVAASVESAICVKTLLQLYRQKASWMS